jgi:hypothetical protein
VTYVGSLQEDAMGCANNQRLMGLMEGLKMEQLVDDGGNPKRTQLGCPLVMYWVYILCYTYCTLFEYRYEDVHVQVHTYYKCSICESCLSHGSVIQCKVA